MILAMDNNLREHCQCMVNSRGFSHARIAHKAKATRIGVGSSHASESCVLLVHAILEFTHFLHPCLLNRIPRYIACPNCRVNLPGNFARFTPGHKNLRQALDALPPLISRQFSLHSIIRDFSLQNFKQLFIIRIIRQRLNPWIVLVHRSYLRSIYGFRFSHIQLVFQHSSSSSSASCAKKSE